MFQGQSSLIVVLLYSFAYVLLSRGQDYRAGMALGLALVKFQFAVPLALIFLCRRKWGFLGGFLTMAGVLSLISLIAIGWTGMMGYIHLLTAVAIHPDNSSFGAAAGMATVEGFVHATAGGILGHTLSVALVTVISGLLIVWTGWKWNRIDQANDRRCDDLMFAAAIVISLITGFHMFTHDLSPMILALLLVSMHVTKIASIAMRSQLITCLILFWIPPLYFGLLAWHRFYYLFPLLLVFAAGVIIAAANLESADRATLRSRELRSLPGVVPI